MSIRFSTLFTAGDVRDYLFNDEGIRQAMEWCRKLTITHVYIESFRNDYTVPSHILVRARDLFKEGGFGVSGCITTSRFGKISTGWEAVSCYTDELTQSKVQEAFEYAAQIFDEIMVDDFLFTDCECSDCVAAKGESSWSEFRCNQLLDLSINRILEPAKRVNPKVKIIIKYPQWYDDLHFRGYDAEKQTLEFDKVWVGTETRDPDNEKWDRVAQFEAYFNMRWMERVGGEKTGGGWFDPYGTSPRTYIEQAIQTILGGAKEALLFCYGSLQRVREQDNGPANVEAFREQLPGLMKLADLVHNKPTLGLLAPKPLNSDPGQDKYIFDFIGMLGFPLVPTHELSLDASCAFLSSHVLKAVGWKEFVASMIESGRPLLLTNSIAEMICKQLKLDEENMGKVEILQVGDEPRDLYKLSIEDLNRIRIPLLAPFGVEFKAPSRTALYLFGDDMEVIENFNDEPIEVSLKISGRRFSDYRIIEQVLPAGEQCELLHKEYGTFIIRMAARSLVVLKG